MNRKRHTFIVQKSCMLRTAATLLALSAIISAQPKKISDDEVMRVHQAALLIDTHNDVTSKTVQGFDIGERAKDGHTDIPRMRTGGLGAQFFAVYVAGQLCAGQPLRQPRAANDRHRSRMTSRTLSQRLRPRPHRRRHRSRPPRGKIAALYGHRRRPCHRGQLRLLRDFYGLGIRYMTLTHSNTNIWADSSGDMDSPSNTTTASPTSASRWCAR